MPRNCREAILGGILLAQLAPGAAKAQAIIGNLPLPADGSGHILNTLAHRGFGFHMGAVPYT